MRQLPSVISSKINQSLQTIGNNANPKMEIQISRAKTTVSDSTYWSVETIRTEDGLGDLSLAARRTKAHGSPDGIYNIYVDNGMVKTAIRDYPASTQEKWKYQFDLGLGNAVAIAFDGAWERWRKKWQLATDEKPWLFWVDDTGKLFAQVWDEIETRLELSSEVTKVKAIRAWKNVEVPTLDQGVVVGYIKNDGNVYYRNYSYQDSGEFTWEYEKQILEIIGPSVNLNMFITNDYRMGFVTENSLGQISWVITPRMWAGMAVPIEKIETNIDTNFTVVRTPHHNTAEEIRLNIALADVFFNMTTPIYPTILDVYNTDMLSFSVQCSHELFNDLYNVASAFKLRDSANNYLEILYTEPGDNQSIIKIFTSNFSHITGNMYLEYDSTVLELCVPHDGSLFGINTTLFEFEPEITIDLTDKDVIYTTVSPVFNTIHTPHINSYNNDNIAINLDILFTTTQVYYKYAYSSDNINSTIIPTFIVTKVGNNPL